jgi:NADH-ubiquinone oxidoreductase chain 5
LWEGVGICSYLLINFWFRRLQANKAAIQAILINRIGDWGFSLGLFSIFIIFGNLDLTTIMTLAPIINGNILNIITLFLLLGAMAKSAQIGHMKALKMELIYKRSNLYLRLFN